MLLAQTILYHKVILYQ